MLRDSQIIQGEMLQKEIRLYEENFVLLFFLVSISSTLIAVLMQRFYLSGDTHISAEECSKSGMRSVSV